MFQARCVCGELITTGHMCNFSPAITPTTNSNPPAPEKAREAFDKAWEDALIDGNGAVHMFTRERGEELLEKEAALDPALADLEAVKCAHEVVVKERDELQRRWTLEISSATDMYVAKNNRISQLVTKCDAMAAEKIGLLQLIDGQAKQLAEVDDMFKKWKNENRSIANLERALAYAKKTLAGAVTYGADYQKYLDEILRLERADDQPT